MAANAGVGLIRLQTTAIRLMAVRGEVLALMVLAAAVAIGAAAEIGAKTVRNQVSIIFSKLGVNSRAQAIVRARDAALVAPRGKVGSIRPAQSAVAA